jgi:KamA family protein
MKVVGVVIDPVQGAILQEDAHQKIIKDPTLRGGILVIGEDLDLPLEDIIEGILDLLQGDIEEIILSGGDPLALTDTHLFELITAIEAIPHVKRLRIHSRLPIVLPQRITLALCQRLAASRLTCVMVVHANHANELAADVALACQLLRQHEVQLLNQSVLLARVNDNLSSLKHLSERLVDIGIMPYYLHLPDHVAGTTHFFVSLERGQSIVAQMQACMSGYLVPKLVREEPGKTSKTLY